MQKTSSVGISLPKDILEKIDAERHDVPRSKFLLRIIQNSYLKNKDKNYIIENTSHANQNNIVEKNRNE